MRPERVNQVISLEDIDGAAFVGATQEDHCSLERQLEVQFPALGKRFSWWCCFDAWCASTAGCIHEAIGALRELGKIFVLEATPDLGLPAAVIAFDGGLESSLVGRREDWGDAELQAKPDHASQGIGKRSIAEKDAIVVELSVFRQTVLAPMRNQRFDCEFGSPNGSHPTAAESPVQADAVEDHNLGPAADDKAFHEIEAVEFRLVRNHAWQVPPFGRRRTANSYPSIERTATEEDSANGADCWDPLQAAICESTIDGHGAVFTKIAGHSELLSQSQDQLLQPPWRRPCSTSSTAGRICPVDAVRAFLACTSKPVLNGRQSHTKSPCDGSQRLPATHSGNNPPSPLLNPVFRPSSTFRLQKVSLHSDRI